MIDFPHVAAGQAILSAIAISTANPWLGTQREPGPTPTDLIHDLHAAAMISPMRYLNNGDKLDAHTELASLPTALLDADWLPAPQGNAPVSLSFTAPVDETAYLLHAPATPTPAAPWQDTGLTAQGISQTEADKTYRIYQRPLPAGTQLSLAQAETILLKRALPSPIAANPPRRPVILYPADKATLTNATLINNAIRLNTGASTIRWRFTTGISGSYRMLLKYDLPQSQDAFATACILDEQGNEVDSAPIHLTGPEKADAKPKPIAITVTLNAGNYDLVVNIKDAHNLIVESLQVQ